MTLKDVQERAPENVVIATNDVELTDVKCRHVTGLAMSVATDIHISSVTGEHLLHARTFGEETLLLAKQWKT